jgi:hypothetical protein
MKKHKNKTQQLALTQGASPQSRSKNGAHSVRKVRSTRARIKQWHGAFLRSLARTPSVTIAARAAGVSTRACYKARDADPAFAEAWADAVNKSVDVLEDAVYQRALKEDSQLAMFVLKAFRPERYRETSKLEIDQRFCGVLIVPPKEDLPP